NLGARKPRPGRLPEGCIRGDPRPSRPGLGPAPPLHGRANRRVPLRAGHDQLLLLGLRPRLLAAGRGAAGCICPGRAALGAGAAQFPDLAELTCFADYKLPQALRHLNALQYSGELSRKIDNWVELPAGSEEETEIRAATVVAVDRLRDLLEEAGRPLLAIEVDWILWSYAQGLFPVRPYHRVRTVFY